MFCYVSYHCARAHRDMETIYQAAHFVNTLRVTQVYMQSMAPAYSVATVPSSNLENQSLLKYIITMLIKTQGFI